MTGSGLPWPWRLLLALMAAALAIALGRDASIAAPNDLIHDFHAARWGYPVDGDVVMIAIDDTSLREIGQWPWPRSVHAELLERLREAGVRGAALDLILAEQDRFDPAHDLRLAMALERNGRVVLPVIPTMQHQSGPPIEVLPNPVIADRVPALGHTDVELAESGTARDLYLHAGLGEARWPALALALLQLDTSGNGAGATGITDIPGLRRPAGLEASPYQWVRDHQVRIRYAGPPGTFAEIPYLDVIEGRVPEDALRDRWVVVGVTATGLAPGIRTPMSGLPMNGVEYQANIVEMLLHDRAIVPLAPMSQAAITGLIVLAAVLLMLSPGVLRPLLGMTGGIMLALASSVAILRLGNLWFAPAAAMAVTALGYLLWMGRHLLLWRRQAHIDTLTMLANRRYFDAAFERRLAHSRRSHSPFSLLLIDVDHFKRFNDSQGHQAGDTLLVQVARTIARHARRAGDLAARFGGDEFALILPDTPAAGATKVAGDILADLRQQSIPATLSIGICALVPGIDTRPGMLFEHADMALYRAKQEGRDRYALYEEEAT